jgi:sterol desaturase/sphingolipid hydroxylase (fatty acid hydroxylase superfamily)
MGKYAFTFGSGFLMGYCAYMTLHYILHKVPVPKRFNWWWNFHNIHHYQQHDRAFGVTSPLWDIIFRTMPEENRRTVEIELAKPDEEFKRNH